MREYKRQILYILILTVCVVTIVGGIVYFFNTIASALLGIIAYREVNDSTKLIKVSSEDINLASKSLTRIFLGSIIIMFIINLILTEIISKIVKVILKRTIEKRKNERTTSDS